MVSIGLDHSCWGPPTLAGLTLLRMQSLYALPVEQSRAEVVYVPSFNTPIQQLFPSVFLNSYYLNPNLW